MLQRLLSAGVRALWASVGCQLAHAEQPKAWLRQRSECAAAAAAASQVAGTAAGGGRGAPARP